MDVVVLVSGRGSNLRAICSAIDAGTCAANVVGVISDRRKAAALEFAEERGIPTRTASLRKGDDRNAWNLSLADEVAALKPDLIVLAGFMRVLGAPMLAIVVAASSSSMPPGVRNSTASMRHQIGKSSPARCLQARTTSHSSRARFSTGPP